MRNYELILRRLKSDVCLLFCASQNHVFPYGVMELVEGRYDGEIVVKYFTTVTTYRDAIVGLRI